MFVHFVEKTAVMVTSEKGREENGGWNDMGQLRNLVLASWSIKMKTLTMSTVIQCCHQAGQRNPLEGA